MKKKKKEKKKNKEEGKEEEKRECILTWIYYSVVQSEIIKVFGHPWKPALGFARFL